MKQKSPALCSLALALLCGCSPTCPNTTLCQDTAQSAHFQESFPATLLTPQDFSLAFQSGYDSAKAEIWVRSPEETANSIVIFLGDPSVASSQEVDADCWLVAIPSTRPSLGYQLLAEGDFWGCLDLFLKRFPQAENLPIYLVGLEGQADQAARLVHEYRHRFSGLVVAGGMERVNYANLRNFPVACLQDPSEQRTTLWNAPSLAQVLAKESSLVSVVPNVKKGLKSLAQAQNIRPLLPLLELMEESPPQICSWLKLVAKHSQSQPAWISGELEGSTITLKTNNIKSLDIVSYDPKFPKNITQISWEGNLYTIPPESSLTLGADEHSPNLFHRKADLPGGMWNFLRKEPVCIIYQDQDAAPEYLEECKRIAQKIARLEMRGLPPMAANLPMYGLSQYPLDKLAQHRAFLVGQSSCFSPLLWPTAQSWPAELKGQEPQELTFTLTLPPERRLPLKLAFMLFAPTTEALTALAEQTLQATHLFQADPCRLYSFQEGRLRRLSSLCANAHWRYQMDSPSGMSIPQQDHLVWDTYLRTRLVGAAQVEGAVLPTLINVGSPSPDRLNAAQLMRYVLPLELAEVTLLGSGAAEAANFLLQYAEAEGLEDYIGIDGLVDAALLRKQTVKILVEADLLRKMPEKVRRLIAYEPVLLSPQQLALNLLEENPQEVGRALVKTANLISLNR